MNSDLLQIRDLSTQFHTEDGLVRAVDGVSFDVREGECLGLVGESGSGKTTAGRTIVRLLEPTAGELVFRRADRCVDVAGLPQRELKDVRRDMQMIFQDPYASLNPRMTVFDIVGEPLLMHGMRRAEERRAHVRDLLARVGLDPLVMPILA